MKKLLLIIIVIGVLSYLGIIKINPERTKEVLSKAGNATIEQVKKIDTAKISNAVKTAGAAVEKAAATAQEASAE